MGSHWEHCGFSLESEGPLWELFHENSKLGRFSSGPSDSSLEETMAQLYESLPYNGLPTIPLPTDLPKLQMPVERALRSRATAHNMDPYCLEIKYLAALLYYAYGVTRGKKDSRCPRALRVIPSAGALYPIEIFIHINTVKNVHTGLFHYNPLKHHIRCLRSETNCDAMQRCFVPGAVSSHASVVFFLTGLFERSTFKYGNRGYRFALLEAGHIAQNINLVSSALKLGCKNIGGFYDREVDAYLELDGLCHSTIYTVAVGMKRHGGQNKSTERTL